MKGFWIETHLQGSLLMPTKVKEAIRMLEQDGWFLIATRGSHRQFGHEEKPGRVTVAGKLSDDLAIGTWKSIMKQAGLKDTP
jgi:predicted RNA binding protein YcfA (HicA-like mRNA interferase family)